MEGERVREADEEDQRDLGYFNGVVYSLSSLTFHPQPSSQTSCL